MFNLRKFGTPTTLSFSQRPFSSILSNSKFTNKESFMPTRSFIPTRSFMTPSLQQKFTKSFTSKPLISPLQQKRTFTPNTFKKWYENSLLKDIVDTSVVSTMFILVTFMLSVLTLCMLTIVVTPFVYLLTIVVTPFVYLHHYVGKNK